ncbi:MAG: hypothetical protein RLO37_29565 [Coleofasciculus chthonoplastes F1-TOW-03]
MNNHILCDRLNLWAQGDPSLLSGLPLRINAGGGRPEPIEWTTVVN